MLSKIISGGQSGVDVSGLKAAKLYDLCTGGTMPKGWITQDGSKPEYEKEYGMVESESDKYPPRTYNNAKNSDATLRLAYDFSTAGENCTLRAIQQYNKPYLDVNLMQEDNDPAEVAKWIIEGGYQCVNVAGNSNRTSPGIEKVAFDFLCKVFECLGLKRRE